MMRSLTLENVRSVFRLIAEIRESSQYPDVWRPHMVSSLSALIGADSAMACESRTPLGYPPRPKPGAVSFGWSPHEEATWRKLDLATARHVDPAVPLQDRGESMPLTCRRRDLLDDARWYAAPYVNDVLRRVGVDDNIVSICSLRDGIGVRGLAFFRSWQGRPFSERERDMIRLFHEEIGRLWNRDPVDHACSLSPRLSEILDCLLDGHSEKQISDRLAISYHTVHDYVKRLYMRFGVRSRAELFAKATGRHPENRVHVAPTRVMPLSHK